MRFSLGFFLPILIASSSVLAQDVTNGRVLLSGKSTVCGMLNLTQTQDGHLTINGRITGLT